MDKEAVRTHATIAPKKILVLGGNGFIGSHLVDALIASGYGVKLFDRPNTVSLGGYKQGVEIVYGDLTCEADIAHALLDCDICFHLIATVLPGSSNLDPVFDIETNVIGTLKLLNYTVKFKTKKIIFLSSGGTVYGAPNELPIPEDHPTNPTCSYGISKLAIEKYLFLYKQLHGLNYVILRLANPFGERQRIQASQGAVAVFLGKALNGELIDIWGDGTVIRDYVYIADVVQAMLCALTYEGPEHVFNIGSGQGMSINDVLDNIELATGTKVNRRYTRGRSFDVSASVLSIERALDLLKWQPKTSFITGITRMMNWLAP